ncbi:hypothetical protein GTQ40_10695 [Flavobacteriaceae bacterium R38]|nr:hypothetical protein [Flavobacteriaceae bacterium R38]
MKELLRKITSLFLALLVFFSTVSFTINNHYCGDYLMDSSWFVKADSCNMAIEADASSSSCETIIKKSCCTDEVIHIEGQDELKISFDQLTFDQHLFIASFYQFYINLFEGLEENIIPFKEYSPPPLLADIQVLHQTFLI